MNSFLDYVILDNTIRSYLVAAGVILLAVFLKRYLSTYLAGLLFRLIKRVAKGVDKISFVNLVVAPLNIFLLILITIITLEKLSFPTTPVDLGFTTFVPNFKIYKITLQQLVDTVSIIILIIAFIWLLLRMIDFIAGILEKKANVTEDHSDNQLIVFFKDFFKVIFIINGILLILKFGFHLNIGNIITGLSIAGAAVALSLRESLENLIASFIIFFDKPFSVGDIVKVQTITGTVEKIGLRSTRMRTDQKTFVTVPNKQMVDSILDNLSLRTQRRAFVQLEINGSTPREKMYQLVLGIERILQVHRDKIESHSVYLADISKNAFIVPVEFFTAPILMPDFNALRMDINLQVIDLMNSMEIKLASKETNDLAEA
ncbi:MAG: mechanosensitive ion channel [Chitinophagaceae bacterium]|nr:mechanosensitive ion channel [Chitinophagaceae bacterium]